ncbi:MAG: Serine/threonine-protein kinase PrkC [Syntrophaceae bacterium PtaU1.Bin231]|nr:MAG: Serine/threonine-protein kinase PrkC [Syntrophaceae bacterium PtaU1.Bin231]
MKRIRLVLVFAAAFLMAFASAAAAQQVDAVPNVTGMKAADAQQMLTRQGWKTGMEYRTVADPKQDGTVLATRPPAGARVSKQQVVIVVAGKMADQTRVPSVTGKPLAEAQKILVDNKLNAQVTHQPVAEPQRNGVVIGQKIAVGTPLAPGSMVPLVVGRYEAVKVPHVEGMPWLTAQDTLLKAKLKPSVTFQSISDQSKNTIVLKQSVRAGADVPPGTQVEIAVGRYRTTAEILKEIQNKNKQQSNINDPIPADNVK